MKNNITKTTAFNYTLEEIEQHINRRKAQGENFYIYYPEALYTTVFFTTTLDTVNEVLKAELEKLGYKVRIRLDKQLEIAW